MKLFIAIDLVNENIFLNNNHGVFLENKKQLHYCISAIRNRTLILLNIISKYDHNQQASASNDKLINKHFALQSLSTEFESTITLD